MDVDISSIIQCMQCISASCATVSAHDIHYSNKVLSEMQDSDRCIPLTIYVLELKDRALISAYFIAASMLYNSIKTQLPVDSKRISNKILRVMLQHMDLYEGAHGKVLLQKLASSLAASLLYTPEIAYWEEILDAIGSLCHQTCRDGDRIVKSVVMVS